MRSPAAELRHLVKGGAAGLLLGGIVAASGCVSVGSRSPANGRGSSASGHAIVPDTLAAQPSDPDRLTPSPAEFGHYTTPGSCREAVLTAASFVWRRTQRDTLPYAPEGDTLPTAAVRVARLCGKQFTVQATEPRELRNLLDLRLMMRDDDQARAVVERELSLAATVEARGDVLEQVLESYLAAQPMRLSAAEATLARLDALGRAARVSRLLAHLAMLQQAERGFDVARLRREGDAVAAIDRGMLTPDERDTWAPQLIDAYGGRLMLAWYERPQSIPDLVQQEQQEVMTLRGGQLRYAFNVNIEVVGRHWSMVGQPTPRLTATYWYNTGPDTVRPAPGKVSLFVRVNQNCGGGCYPMYAMIRRLARKYGGAGLQITLMTKTQGSVRGDVAASPQQEADAAGRYFLDSLRLPIALAVDETPFSVAVDGRRVERPVSYERAYPYAEYVLTGRDGTLQMLTWAASEPMLEAFIRRAVGG